jgi:menaquinone reductase, multiheme cytochrome c subunit
MSRFLFPKWSNLALPTIVIVGAGAPLYAAMIVTYGFSPQTQDAGYQPVQPLPFSHKLHAGELGMDCRYCHNTVERSAHAAIPPTQTCMNCHTSIHKDSVKIAKLKESYDSGMPVEWIKVHDLPDYAYFNHSAHINRGVGCVSCHGRIDRMEVVSQQKTLSMGWCLECHRNPDPHLRPVSEMTTMDLELTDKPTDAKREELKKLYHIQPSENCSTCHR